MGELEKEHYIKLAGHMIYQPVNFTDSSGQNWAIKFESIEEAEIRMANDNIKKLSKLANHFRECED